MRPWWGNCATEQADSPLLKYLAGRQACFNKNWQQAKLLLEEARSDLQSESSLLTKVNMLLGVCYQQLGDKDLRLDIAQQAVSQRPLDVQARVNLAEAYIALNRFTAALQQYDEIVQMQPPTVDIMKRYAYLVLSATIRENPDKRNWEPINRLIAGVEKNVPDDPWVTIMKAEVLVSQNAADEEAKAKNFKQAEELLEAAQKKDPNQFRIGNALVQLEVQQGHFDKATEILDQLQQQFGDTAEIREARARLVMRQDGDKGVAEVG